MIKASVLFCALFTSVSAIYFDFNGNALPLSTSLDLADTFAWQYVDPRWAFNYSGSARVINDAKGFSGTCGLTLIKSWDILGKNNASWPGTFTANYDFKTAITRRMQLLLEDAL
jgi:hypothetical protein